MLLCGVAWVVPELHTAIKQHPMEQQGYVAPPPRITSPTPPLSPPPLATRTKQRHKPERDGKLPSGGAEGQALGQVLRDWQID